MFCVFIAKTKVPQKSFHRKDEELVTLDFRLVFLKDRH